LKPDDARGRALDARMIEERRVPLRVGERDAVAQAVHEGIPPSLPFRVTSDTLTARSDDIASNAERRPEAAQAVN
jgi:hypothetical protein